MVSDVWFGVFSFLLRLESVDLQDFFNNNGVLIADRPQNWVLLASLGRPLSRSFWPVGKDC